jgi:hypothetical protein
VGGGSEFKATTGGFTMPMPAFSIFIILAIVKIYKNISIFLITLNYT